MAGEFDNMIQGGRTVSGRPVRLKRITKEDQIDAWLEPAISDPRQLGELLKPPPEGFLN